jgi:hypothetical protein
VARLACISVDLDSLPHYCRIHGLPEALLDERARGLVYRVAVPRFRELLAELSLPATFFAIGEDLLDGEARDALRGARAAGIEVGNHSHSHDYALARRPAPEVEQEVRRGAEAIQAAVGEPPVGFRAPGYTLSAALYGALCEAGYLYDSSTFPATPYYAAKALVMGGLTLLGRPSRSILDTPRVLGAPRGPYRPDAAAPYRRGQGPVLELPIATAPITRLPFIGTWAVAFPGALVRATYRTMRGMEFFNFELHGVDLLDASDGVPAALVRQQRDLRVATAEKRTRLREVFSWLRGDYQVVTLAEAARRLAASV